MAMQGMCSSLPHMTNGSAKGGGPITEAHIAEQAVAFSDALLTALTASKEAL
jgi:hypothetical protein